MAKSKRTTSKPRYKYVVIRGRRAKVDMRVHALVTELLAHGITPTECKMPNRGERTLGIALDPHVSVIIIPSDVDGKQEFVLNWSKPGTNIQDQ